MRVDGIPSHITTAHVHDVRVSLDSDTQEFVAETVKVVLIGSAGLIFLMALLKKV